MPELPEVQRAVNILNKVTKGKTITSVDAVEDAIVFVGINQEDFAKELTGRTVESAERYGKVFWLNLSSPGRMPVLHFGMTGMLQVQSRGSLQPTTKKTPKSASTDWPPRFMKFILHLSDGSQIAFLDARRLGRVRLCQSPRGEPPLADLGFDPILSMPSLEEFVNRALARACPIKALLLDQKFSAGVGNWVAGEFLRLPLPVGSPLTAQMKSSTMLGSIQSSDLTPSLKASLQHCTTKHRMYVRPQLQWMQTTPNSLKTGSSDIAGRAYRGKGKKSASTLKLPTGELATIKWITVGGRTSAFVSELQHLYGPAKNGSSTRGKRKAKDEDEDEATDEKVDSAAPSEMKNTAKKPRTRTASKGKRRPATNQLE
ncbi:MutM-like protein-1 [Mycena indigotica]|uniref:DNA-formamidopyrimidine glycosylase n=1 Tax=Mycena indigotica TaxID=2126181 RepID=A0A8H6W6B0_9AGAR|nr:MutM-like protein-1 [Mycena indigotica]KAF7306497.1 MutM-like protein-1 [Mycena indigotica]